MIARFCKNQSTTSISYQRFNKRTNDIYPTFSICFKGNSFHWYHELAIFEEHGLTSYHYERMLKGKHAFKYEYDVALRLFQKARKRYREQNATVHDYYRFHLAMSDILLEANFIAENMQQTILHRKNLQNLISTDQTLHSIEESFSIGFETPEIICFTRNTSYVKNLIRIEDSLKLNKSLMSSPMFQNTTIQIHIHYPGRLMQALGNPSFASTFREFQWGRWLEIRILQVGLWKKRTDSNSVCNSEILDYDLYLQRVISDKFRCIYPFWFDKLQNARGFMENSSPKIENLQICHLEKTLESIYDYTKNIRSLTFKEAVPCVEQYTTVAWNFAAEIKSRSQTAIRILYLDRYYQEITYSRSFSIESVISNVGGFVGIFLGYSMLQLPEILGRLWLSCFGCYV